MLVAVFLISTAGITVYKHYCSHGGMFYGVFVDVRHDCETDEVEEHEPLHECCNPSAENEFFSSEDCCTSDVNFYQIDTDLLVNDFKIDFIHHFDFNPTVASFVFVPELRISFAPNKAPPVLTTSKRLSLIQQYLI